MSCHSLSWGAAGVEFSLSAPSSEVLNRARQVVGPWALAEPAQSPAIEWSLTEEAGVWRLGGFPDGEVRYYPHLEDALLWVEFSSVGCYVDHPSIIWFHAALLSRDDQALAIVGQSGCGKSTLAVALWKAGWKLWSDDSCLLDPATGLVQPAPRRISLRAGSRELVGAGLWDRLAATPSAGSRGDGLVFHPTDLDSQGCAGALPLGCIVMLGRPGAPPGLARCSGGAALKYLLLQSGLGRTALGVGLRRLSNALARVPLWDLQQAPLPEMLEKVEGLL